MTTQAVSAADTGGRAAIREALYTLGDCFWEYSRDTGEFRISPALADLTGLPPQAGLAAWLDVLQKAEQQAFPGRLQGDSAGLLASGLMQLRDGQGRWRVVSEKLRVLAWGENAEPLWVVARLHLLSAPDGEANNSSRQQETDRGLLRSVIETIPDLVWLKDPDGVYLACNPTFERFFGATEQQILGKTDYDFLPADLV
ncbi:MAG: hypothetical protein RIR00_17, partial [Pseudomonadota bacterium]